MSTHYTVFADESGTASGWDCYAVGALILPTTALFRFDEYFADRHRSHGLSGEVKWQKVRRDSHGMVNFSLELWWNVLRSDASYRCIVVKKADFRNWYVDREAAFYKTYAQLISDTARRLHGDYEVVIDDRQDAYAKQDEALGIITNRMLQKLGARGRIQHLRKADSRDIPGIQAADVLTGAVATAHEMILRERRGRPRGFDNTKKLAIERMAQVIEWDDLCYDTFPNGNFNIWHFPPSWRGDPGTKSIPKRVKRYLPVSRAELRLRKTRDPN
ncbi:MAG: DUF3800 domain-containing protein [Myxococcales bacterium]|nr:DUF3800 domain-containing protein [Myxococcales bacterium]